MKNCQPIDSPSYPAYDQGMDEWVEEQRDMMTLQKVMAIEGEDYVRCLVLENGVVVRPRMVRLANGITALGLIAEKV